ncbi:MAG: siroheme decarboxylase subunit beta [bacterium]
MDALDGKLLNRLQEGMPLVREPFAEIAADLRIPTASAMEKIRKLRGDGIIRWIGAIFDTQSLGYRSALVAFSSESDRIDDVAEVVSAHPGVSHNYGRDHKYNLWFTIATPPGSDITRHIACLAGLSRTPRYLILPALKIYKIGVKLNVVGDCPIRPAESTDIEEDHRREWKPLAPEEIEAIRELQKDMEICDRPFEIPARRLGIGEEELLRRAEKLKRDGRMRRIAAVLRHRRVGFPANGMSVWAVPQERADEVGEIVASFPQVSHCYLRPTSDDWPYSIFGMIHARSREECGDVADAISRETGISDYEILYSTKEYKKVRLRYFTGEVEAWERIHLV